MSLGYTIKITMNIKIDDLKEELVAHLNKTLAPMTKRPAKETAEALLSWERAKEEFSTLNASLNGVMGNLKGKKLLEIGSGYGLFLTLCLKNGIRAEGIEPANQDTYKSTLKISKEILKRSGFNPNVIKQVSAEDLPYRTNSFDLVVSSFTLEHVQNLGKVLKESVRVLKSGGYLYFTVPNYGSFWESHYGIIWIPYLPRFLAPIYVRFWGKNPKFLDELQFVNQLELERIVQKLPLSVLDWGQKLFKDRVIGLKFSDFSTQGSAKKILRFLNFLHLLRFASFIAILFKAQTPIIFLARKGRTHE